MKHSSLTPITLVPLLMATFSLVSMIGLLQIDKIVHGTLYSYGLTFSYTWAQPYWRMAALIFIMGWFNIIAALVFQAYVVTFERKQARRFADAVRDEVMRTRIRAVEVIREARQDAKPTPAPERQKETTVPGSAPKPEADQDKAPEAEIVVQGDSSKEARAPAPTDQQAETQTQPQQKEPEPQPPQPEAQQHENKPETTDKKEETPIIIGIPAEELNAPQ